MAVPRPAAAAQRPPGAESRAGRQPAFACRRAGCNRTFASLDNLVMHASKRHLVDRPARGPARAGGETTKRPAAAGASPLAALSERAARMAAPAAALLTSAGLALSIWARLDMQRELREEAAVAPAEFLDVRPSGYTPEDAAAFLDRLGWEGPLYAALQLEECLLVAPLGAIALSILCTFFLNEISHPPLMLLNLVPFLLPLVKSLETAALLSLVFDRASGASLAPGKVSLAALATVAKVRIVLPVVVGLVLSLGLAVAARWALGAGWRRRVEMRAREWAEEPGESDDEGNPAEDEEEIGLDGGRADEKRTDQKEGKKGKGKSRLAKKTE